MVFHRYCCTAWGFFVWFWEFLGFFFVFGGCFLVFWGFCFCFWWFFCFLFGWLVFCFHLLLLFSFFFVTRVEVEMLRSPSVSEISLLLLVLTTLRKLNFHNLRFTLELQVLLTLLRVSLQIQAVLLCPNIFCWIPF